VFAQKKNQRSTVPVVRRRAGQSLREEWDRLVNENLPFVIFIPGMLWLVWFTQRPAIANKISPDFWLALAIIATGVSAIAYLRLISMARSLIRGERGELRVAEILDDLRVSGYRVYHDLVEDGFNVDHVVVGPTGVYAIETKFRSGSGIIEYRNGDGLFIGSNKLDEDRNPLAQARGSARAVRERLKDDTGLNRHVKAVLVFVGDWRIKNVWRDTDVAVLSTKELPAYFDRHQPELKRDEVKLIASHLERTAKS